MIGTFRRKYQEAKAELKGEAISRARLIKSLRDIEGGTYFEPEKPPTRTAVVLRMLDKTPMVFFSDGSLRHVLNVKRPKGVSARQMRRATKAARAGRSYHIHVKRDSWSSSSR